MSLPLPLLGAVFGASVLGSLHCAGMCGPFVAFYAGSGDAQGAAGSRPPRGLAHLAYNGGRLITYAALGAVAGSLGAALDWVGELAGAQRVAAVGAGLLMVVWGTVALLRAMGIRIAPLVGNGWFTARVGRAARALRKQPAALRAFAMGLLTTLLPCGWLYAFVLAAAASGSALGGAALMGAFWLGTVPMLLGLGVGLQFISAPLRRHIPVVTALAIVMVGLVALSGRAGLDGAAMMGALRQAGSSSSQQDGAIVPAPGAHALVLPEAPACHGGR